MLSTKKQKRLQDILKESKQFIQKVGAGTDIIRIFSIIDVALLNPEVKIADIALQEIKKYSEGISLSYSGAEEIMRKVNKIIKERGK